MARPKPIITILHNAICVKFLLLFVRVWKYLIFLSVRGTMSTKWIPSLIWIVPVG